QANELDALEDLFLRLGAEALELGDFSPLTRRFQLVEVVDAKLVIKGLYFLRTESGHAQHREQPGRGLLLEIFVPGQFARGDESGDLLLERVADAAQLAEFAGRDDITQ